MSKEPPHQSPTQPTQQDPTPTNSPPGPNPNNNNNNANASQPDKPGGGTNQPMELATESQPQQHEIGAFKKFFLKIGTKVGTVKTTEFSEEYLAAVTEIDNYNANLTMLLNSLTKVIQQNAQFIPQSELRPSIDAPMGEDPFELLAKALDGYASLSANKKVTQNLEDSAKKLANAHRDYQGKARKCFHLIRTFLKVDTENMKSEREKVLKCRQEMDFARYETEGKGALSQWKVRSFERAKEAYDTQCKKVITMVKDMSEKRAQHRIEILRYMQEFRNYNDIASKECDKYRAVLDKLIETMPAVPPILQGQNQTDDSQKGH